MNNVKVELKQREHLVSLVQEARNREKQELEEKNGVTEDSLIAEVTESKGFVPMLKQVHSLDDQVRKLKAAISEIDAKFRACGFDRDGEGLVFRNYNAPEAIRKLISDKLESARRPIEKSLKRYDLAVSKIWLATSSEELQKAIEGLF